MTDVRKPERYGKYTYLGMCTYLPYLQVNMCYIQSGVNVLYIGQVLRATFCLGTKLPQSVT